MSTPFKIMLLGLCMSVTGLWAQKQASFPVSTLGTYAGSEKWILFNEEMNVPALSLWNQYGDAMGLGADDDMSLTRSETDALGWSHYRFQQLYKGVPVEFAVYNIHEKVGRAVKGNGEIAKNIDVQVAPVLSYDEAFALALQCIGAKTYYWEVPHYEYMKQLATDDPTATFYPQGELLIVDADFNPRNRPSYHLAWKFEIYAAEPEGRDWVYVDAHNGSIIKELDLVMHESIPATAETRYSGTREIITDSTENGYVLRDDTRGRGVLTFDAVDSTDISYAVDFVDEDNYWANANMRADDAATDAHWAAEQYFDYLRDRHGINSYDNQGSKLICYVHYDINWRNASWAGFWTRYGDAGGNPWTHVDVVGHEFTHGFTWAHSALLYMDEPGGLNESFSDIVGEALQHYAHGGVVDWLETPAPVDTIRSFIDPKAYKDPDTYLGEHWEFGDSDNGGVHTNSGVQNHWFYLLTEGGSGTNDNGDSYTVEGLGMITAMDIVMRNMTTYLFPTAGYYDAREGSLQAAEDLFGSCSFEYQQVANAWYAVGVGAPVNAQDFTVLEVEGYDLCIVDGMAPVKMKVKHLGCDSTGPLTLLLTMLKTNPNVSVTDTLDIPQGVGPGEVIEYEFTKEFNFSKKGEHSLIGKVVSAGDLNNGNDISRPTLIHNLSPVSNQDFRFHSRIALRTFRDSMAFYVGDFAHLLVWFNAGRDSTYGIRIEGDRLRYANPVYDGQDLFDINPRLGTQICFCVDAGGLDSLGLQFDLRQTYSSDLEMTVGEDQPKSSALRVMADTSELGRFFPRTHDMDDWETVNLDLEDYLGSQFVLCFETRTLVSLAESEDSIGDRVYLDNIEFIGKEVSASLLPIKETGSLVVYPNPTTDDIVIEIPSSGNGFAEVVVTDIDGCVLQKHKMMLTPGMNRAQFNIATVSSGVYFVEVRTAQETMVGKIIKQ